MKVTIDAPWAVMTLGLLCMFAGALGFAVVLEIIHRRRHAVPPPDDTPAASPWIAAARQWAYDRGTPGLADWAADRAQTLFDLREAKPSKRGDKKGAWRR